jgi:hypothetical protein
MDDLPPRLAFTLIDADPDVPGFGIAGGADGFHGRTEVWASRADLAAFLAALAEFDAALKGEMRWRAGFEPEPSFQLLIRPEGASGRLAVAADIAASHAAQSQHRVQFSFVLPEPNALTRFRLGLAALLRGDATEDAVLTPAHREAGV